jgi:endonuclease III
MSRLDLREVVDQLPDPAGEPLTDAFAILAFENIGYLIDDETRSALFEELKGRIGLSPAAILAAPDEALLDITRRGGMHPDKRAERLRAVARIAIEQCGGDIAGKLASLPPSKAKALLKGFPGIGAPGADRILLFGGYAVVPALESNGLRAMVRMGFCMERPSWDATYRDAVALIAERGEMSRDWLMRAWLALRDHGKTLCRRSRPECLACPFDELCAHSVTTSL